MGLNSYLKFRGDIDDCNMLHVGVFRCSSAANAPYSSDIGVLNSIQGLHDGIYMVQYYSSLIKQTTFCRFKVDKDWTSWKRLDNFGYNTIEELSTGVAALLSSGGLFPFMYRGNINDSNTKTSSGMYRGNANNVNTPLNYGVLVVFAAIDFIQQLFLTSGNDQHVYLRNSTSSGVNWTDWISIH